MFELPEDLARAALELLDVNDAALQPRALAAIELGAATVANHVWDWDLKTRNPPLDKPAFKERFPEWDLLRQISNGIKHARLRPNVFREPAWEDDDFWYAYQGRATLFVEVDGHERAVAALIRTFVNSYLSSNSAHTQ